MSQKAKDRDWAKIGIKPAEDDKSKKKKDK